MLALYHPTSVPCWLLLATQLSDIVEVFLLLVLFYKIILKFASDLSAKEDKRDVNKCFDTYGNLKCSDTENETFSFIHLLFPLFHEIWLISCISSALNSADAILAFLDTGKGLKQILIWY